VTGGRLIHVAGRDQQLTLPGSLWPAGCDRGQSDPLFFAPVTKRQANELIASFGGHPCGPYDRRFGYQAWGLAVDGQAAAVAVSGSTVGVSAAGYNRFRCVDLARIARHPDHPGIMRVMLRLWRDYLAAKWADQYWPVDAAVSYALPGKAGNLYRFDGWTRWGTVKARKGPQGGSSWSGPSKAQDIADGVMTVWYYPYSPAPGGSGQP
jgi:hypothetical protein